MKIHIKIPPSIKDRLSHMGRVSVTQKIFFVQQLGIMIKTGISLAIALKTLSKETKNKRFKGILTDIEQGVEQGNFLSVELSKHQKVFSELFVNMVKSGEASGRLETVLEQLYVQMKKDHAIVSKVRGALIYPAILLSAMVGVGGLMVVYVIPNIISIFDEVDIPLPLATRILIGISKFVNLYGLYIFIVGIILLIAFLRFIRLPYGKRMLHKTLLKIPIMGQIMKKINIARFCRTFSSLLKTDIAIIKTFEITSNVLGNRLYRDALRDAQEKIKKGQRIEEALRVYDKLFPPVTLQMIAIGEETGSLDTILEQAAQFYEEDIDQIMTNLPSIIEPVLILILGVAVAGMAVAVLMPIYSLSQSI